MARVKKIIKAEEGVKLNAPTTQPTPQYKKFKMGSREFDLSNDFMTGLEDELVKSGIQGNAVGEMMNLIKSGEIHGIDEGGNFYGTNVGGTDKNTRKNRAWDVGKKDIINRQNVSPGMVSAIRSVYGRMNAPKPEEAAKAMNLSNKASNIRDTYGYHGNAIDDKTWRNLSLQNRVDIFGKSLRGYQDKFSTLGDYDAKIHGSINEQTYNLLKGNHAGMADRWDELSKKWMEDGKISSDEINQFYTEYGIDGAGLFDERVLSESELAEKNRLEAEAKKKEDEEKANKIAYDSETGTYSKGGLDYSGYTKNDNGEELLIHEGRPLTDIRTIDNEHVPFFKGKPYSATDLDSMYENPTYAADKNDIFKLRSSIAEIRNSFLPDDGDRTGGRGYTDGKPAQFLDDKLAPQDTDGQYRLYTINDTASPTKYGVTGKQTTVLESGKKRYEGKIKTVDGKSYFESNSGEIIPLTGDPSTRNADYFHEKSPTRNLSNTAQASIQPTNKKASYFDGALPEPTLTREQFKNLTYQERRNYVNRHGHNFIRSHKNGGVLFAQKGDKLTYQEAPTEYRDMGTSVDFDKLNQYRESTKNNRNLSQNPATMREWFGDDVSLSDADKADITALIMDAGGLAAGFVPGGNFVSGGLGIGSTITQGIADYKRKGDWTWSDTGRVVGSLGLDVASLVPFAGQAAKTSKLLKTIGKSQRVLGRLFTAYGLTNGAQGLANVISKGKDASADDIRMLMQGLQGLGGVMKGGFTGKGGMQKWGTKETAKKFGVKVGKDNVEFDTREAAEAFGNKHKAFKAKSAELQKLGSGDNVDQTKLKALGDEVQGLATELRSAGGNKFDLTGSVKEKTALNPFTFKKPKKGDLSPIGMKDKDAKIYETSTREILGKGEGTNWLESYSAVWLRNNRNVFPGVKRKGSAFNPNAEVENTTNKGKNKNTTPSETTDNKRKYITGKEKRQQIAAGSEKRNERAARKQAETDAENKRISDREKRLKDLRQKREHERNVEYDKKLRETQDAKKIDDQKLGEEMGAGREAAKASREGKQSKYLMEQSDAKKAREDLESTREVNRAKKEVSHDKRVAAGKKGQEAMKKNQQERTDAETKKKREEALEKADKSINEDNFTSGEKSAAKARQELEDARDLLEQKIVELDNSKSKGPKIRRKDRRNATKGQDRSFNRSDSHDTEKSKGKAKDRKNYNKTRKNLENEGIYIRKEGGLLIPKYQNPFGSLGFKSKFESKPLFTPGQNPLGSFAPKSELESFGYKPRELNLPTTKSLQQTMLESDPNYQAVKMQRFYDQNKTTPTGDIVTANSDNDVEQGRNWKAIMGVANKMADPANIRFASTLIGNKKMMDEVKNAKRPTNAAPIQLNRMKGIGMGQVMPQISEVNQMVNGQKPAYSDAKLNAAVQLAQLSEANKVKDNAYGQLSAQNQQIDAQNNQISQQEKLQNAQIAQGNAAQQDAHNQWLLSNKLGLTRSNYDAFANRMMEMENKAAKNKMQLDALEDQELLMNNQLEYQKNFENFQKKYDDDATAAGKSWSDYYAGMTESDRNAYNKAKMQMQVASQSDLLKNRKEYLKKPNYFASGGKMTLSEKKELEELKAKKKSQLESDKAFNKLMIEKSKSHDKMLSLLSKDTKASMKNILKK